MEALPLRLPAIEYQIYMIENYASPDSVFISEIDKIASDPGRIAALDAYHILDTVEEKDFDQLTELASIICQTPVALVSLVDKDRQWFKSHIGTAVRETPISVSFCTHAITSGAQIMIVPDLTADIRFSGNPLVTGDPNVAFYAGVPLVTDQGYPLGTLCVLDHKAKELNETQISALKVLARQVMDKLELRKKILELEISNQKILQSEDRFRTLVSKAPVAIAIYTGKDMIIEQANERMLNLLGRTADIIGRPLLAARPELRGHQYMEILEEVFISGIEHQGQAVKGPVLRNGEVTDGYFDVNYKAVKGEDGLVQSVMVVATDVTEKVKLALREAEMNEELMTMNEELTSTNEDLNMSRDHMAMINQRLELALEAGALGSYDLELETGKISCTPQCKMNFGLEPGQEFNYADLFGAMLPEYHQPVKEKIEDAIVNHSTYRSEYQIKWPDGSIHWISARGKARYDSTGRAYRIVGVTMDITESKIFEQRKDDFLSIASHELKTPLTTLKASIQLLNLIKNRPFTERHTTLIEHSARSMDKISALIDDLLNINRMSQGQLNLEKSVFCMTKMLSNSCNHVRMTGNHELFVQGEADLMVFADEHRIDQVVINFVNNAVKYAPNGKEIYLTAERINDQIKVSVKDHGPGISEELLPHLFERYYRADHSGQAYTGLGLGLYICSEIIKRHGGEIGAESKLGEGSTFWFTLPAEN